MYPEEKLDFRTDKQEANIYKSIVETTDRNSRQSSRARKCLICNRLTFIFSCRKFQFLKIYSSQKYQSVITFFAPALEN